jgi:mono/diheme cytochrome c family protein
MRKLLYFFLIVIVLGVCFALALQLVPYGRNHTNPHVIAEPQWDAPQTRVLFMRACGDCHSNETQWPWYSNIAPVSWLIQRHVDEGREKLNVSQWRVGAYDEAGESAEKMREGSMPPSNYLPLHPEAMLSPADKNALAKGLAATFGERTRRRRQ